MLRQPACCSTTGELDPSTRQIAPRGERRTHLIDMNHGLAGILLPHQRLSRSHCRASLVRQVCRRSPRPTSAARRSARPDRAYRPRVLRPDGLLPRQRRFQPGRLAPAFLSRSTRGKKAFGVASEADHALFITDVALSSYVIATTARRRRLPASYTSPATRAFPPRRQPHALCGRTAAHRRRAAQIVELYTSKTRPADATTPAPAGSGRKWKHCQGGRANRAPSACRGGEGYRP